MELKSLILTPYNIVILLISIFFLLLPILNISAQTSAVIGLVNLLAFLINLRFKRLELFAKFFVPIFNIIVFSFQIYNAFTFFNIGLNLNVYITIISASIFLALNVMLLLFYGS
ncbi:MAG: hypothetical protein N3F64_00030 [Nitrososphaeria archaeon]|nr:hypothetical protein [Nitrososphaeria archaeon]